MLLQCNYDHCPRDGRYVSYKQCRICTHNPLRLQKYTQVVQGLQLCNYDADLTETEVSVDEKGGENSGS